MQPQNHCNKDNCAKAVKLNSFTIEEVTYFLPADLYFVKDLKKMANIPESHQLVRVLDDKLLFLENGGCVAIDGNEVFQSCAGSGQAS